MTLTFFNVGYGEAVLAECPDPARPRGSFIMLLDGGSGEAEDDRLFYFDDEKPAPAMPVGTRVRVVSNDRMVIDIREAQEA